jgi:hypothetical protein
MCGSCYLAHLYLVGKMDKRDVYTNHLQRSKHPPHSQSAELPDPMVAFSIFASVTITRTGMFTTLSEGLEFIARFLKGFMIGFAIATGVSLLILPITSRGNVFHDIKEYLASVGDVLQARISFADAGTVTGLLTGRGLLRRARTAMDTRHSQGKTDLQSKQKQLQ